MGGPPGGLWEEHNSFPDFNVAVSLVHYQAVCFLEQIYDFPEDDEGCAHASLHLCTIATGNLARLAQTILLPVNCLSCLTR